ncbi:MAG: hypothetical protein WD651_00495 [Acidimicrobiia bacterium]
MTWSAWLQLSPDPVRKLPDDFNLVPGYGPGLITTLAGSLLGIVFSLAWLARHAEARPVTVP